MILLKNLIKVAVVFLITTTVQAQTCTVSGKIIDAKTLEPLPFASVFFNNTTIGAMSDANGDFVLANILQPSIHELIVSFLGYEHYKIKLSLSASELKLGIVRLKPLETELTAVVVSAPKDRPFAWKKNCGYFKFTDRN